MYNWWLHFVFAMGPICFAADCYIIMCKQNYLGSWNHSDTSLCFRFKLLDPAVCPPVHINFVSDSAFPCSTAMTVRILTPLKDGDIDRIMTLLCSLARTLDNAIKSVRQVAELGTR
ncbi:hypothetical protein PF005_g9015 [Phytophthora fragariae]|uniref:DDE Tnp4 domain-containing protein n=1 Tax=Phytophthora fragariae TaxID=53985 RepID=A0A6A3ZQJ1_9STRA|nr:hypothetical protein PF003_g3620 [Phytophthora fragariae]KAE8940835.1 hypothetical protein PF009_g9364 [Phytophthora fragariae]KAE9118005.1 hypothetical protein PF007_g9080 [Phytophthora fragariae]KAE9118613.1 hypothetical protein PF010_g8151 [Phytophthora fragariae]KAE9146977.1 hypothetical protein PF006_g8303 [Phytophthora fragariae]